MADGQQRATTGDSAAPVDGAEELASIRFEADGKTPRSGSRAYTLKAYWEQRFSNEEQYDWLTGYESIRPLLRKVVKPEDRILLIGCGNSTLTADLHRDGFRNLVSTDYSATVISAMREKCPPADFPGLSWEVQDMTALTYDAGSFDVVLDKAGMDAVLADGGDKWELDPALCASARRIMRSCWRTLKPGGLFLQLTFSQPHFRRRYLLHQPSLSANRPPAEWSHSDAWWRMRVRQVDAGLGYFWFEMQRRAAAPVDWAPSAAIEAADGGVGGGGGEGAGSTWMAGPALWSATELGEEEPAENGPADGAEEDEDEEDGDSDGEGDGGLMGPLAAML